MQFTYVNFEKWTCFMFMLKLQKKKKMRNIKKMTLQLLHTLLLRILKIRLSAKYKLENSNLINRTTSLKVTEIPVRLDL